MRKFWGNNGSHFKKRNIRLQATKDRYIISADKSSQKSFKYDCTQVVTTNNIKLIIIEKKKQCRISII